MRLTPHHAQGNQHFVCGYVACCRILSTRSQESGFSLNCDEESATLPAGSYAVNVQRKYYLIKDDLGLLLL